MDVKLSIIIPVYNAEKYIEECLKSILPELDDEIEILLIDDGSKDTSYQIIKKYESRNVRLFHHENKGVSHTRNIGIQNAKGNYILFVDADDKLDTGWKNVISNGYNSKEDVIYYSLGFKGFESFNRINIIYSIFGINDSNTKMNLSSPWSKLYKREFLLKNHIEFDDELINGEDGIFNLSVILKSRNYTCNKASFYKYRIYMDSSSRKFNEKFFDSNLKYFSLAEKLLLENDINDYDIKRCMSYAVTYSTYLYLFLLSNLDSNRRNILVQKIWKSKLYEYMKFYPCSKDCNIIVQSVYCLLKHKCFWGAQKIMNIRNKVRNMHKKGNMKWEII